MVIWRVGIVMFTCVSVVELVVGMESRYVSSARLSVCGWVYEWDHGSVIAMATRFA